MEAQKEAPRARRTPDRELQRIENTILKNAIFHDLQAETRDSKQLFFLAIPCSYEQVMIPASQGLRTLHASHLHCVCMASTCAYALAWYGVFCPCGVVWCGVVAYCLLQPLHGCARENRFRVTLTCSNGESICEKGIVHTCLVMMT